MKKKNISSILDNCDVSASQEIYLQRCGFAVHGQPPPDSDPSVGISPPPLNDGVVTSHRASDDSESDSVLDSGYDVVDREAIGLVSLEESSDTVVLEDDEADSTVGIVAEKRNGFSAESSENRRDEGKKLEIPLRDVVKAIVMNSRNPEKEKNKEIEKTSFVQILMNKGFKFQGKIFNICPQIKTAGSELGVFLGFFEIKFCCNIVEAMIKSENLTVTNHSSYSSVSHNTTTLDDYKIIISPT